MWEFPSIRELENRHSGEDIYILGTGTSLRVFDLSVLEGKIVIGLNQAWRRFPVTYGITMRPELNLPELMNDADISECDYDTSGIKWVVKKDKLPQGWGARVVDAEQRMFWFEGNKNRTPEVKHSGDPSTVNKCVEFITENHPTKLYLWSSIAQSAMHLAANMGAKNIFMVGCDNCSIGGNHHAHLQHTFWKGEDPNIRYLQYYEGNAEVRTALRGRGVSVFSLTPFLKLDAPELDFKRLAGELGKPLLVQGNDISSGFSLAEQNKSFLRLARRMISINIKAICGR